MCVFVAEVQGLMLYKSFNKILLGHYLNTFAVVIMTCHEKA